MRWRRRRFTTHFFSSTTFISFSPTSIIADLWPSAYSSSHSPLPRYTGNAANQGRAEQRVTYLIHQLESAAKESERPSSSQTENSQGITLDDSRQEATRSRSKSYPHFLFILIPKNHNQFFPPTGNRAFNAGKTRRFLQRFPFWSRHQARNEPRRALVPSKKGANEAESPRSCSC
ncbi:hypothetical protein QC761_0108390 [Podospora bellae-mahoneyi]|uniref:Uncharacterized protein n=1 Tax=Podospora bellae-mahoneyi TaxID=2093777 RepID=A0ABR0F8W1_9PEZI|nr:hypothetical protein QC761_0108390 [Podospora bellae-mahoneyi]